MTTVASDVRQFGARFGVPRPTTVGLPSKDVLDFRVGCLKEELREIEEALAQGDLAGALDGLVDLGYFAVGTSDLCGASFDRVWAAVHEANMRKVRGDGSPVPGKPHRGHRLDVRKPPGWRPPDVAGVLTSRLIYAHGSVALALRNPDGHPTPGLAFPVLSDVDEVRSTTWCRNGAAFTDLSPLLVAGAPLPDAVVDWEGDPLHEGADEGLFGLPRLTLDEQHLVVDDVVVPSVVRKLREFAEGLLSPPPGGP